jgi:hypothetical protein
MHEYTEGICGNILSMEHDLKREFEILLTESFKAGVPGCLFGTEAQRKRGRRCPGKPSPKPTPVFGIFEIGNVSGRGWFE